MVYFVIHEMGLGKICPYTKFEVSSFTRSKDTVPELIVREYVFYFFNQKMRFYVFLNDMSKNIENAIKSIKSIER